ncbi:MAG: hypothetical protein GY809_02910 [Planctomycetes bacterium]|nr:hypothetical protein [Planctomycetota bacterium]
MRSLKDEVWACTDAEIRTLEAEKEYELIFEFPKDFTGFSGHFPQFPVLPAFIQMLIGQCVVEIRSHCPCRPCRVKKAKFMKTITPGQEVTVRWSEQLVGDFLKGSFTLWVDRQKVASFSMEFSCTGGAHA